MKDLYQKEAEAFIKEWGWTKRQQRGFFKYFFNCTYCGDEILRDYKRNQATCYSCKKRARLERFLKGKMIK